MNNNETDYYFNEDSDHGSQPYDRDDWDPFEEDHDHALYSKNLNVVRLQQFYSKRDISSATTACKTEISMRDVFLGPRAPGSQKRIPSKPRSCLFSKRGLNVEEMDCSA